MSDLICDRTILLKNYLSPETMDSTCLFSGPAARLSNKYVKDLAGNYQELAPNKQGKNC